MPYGTIKVDNVIYTKGGVDTTITVSGIVDSLSGAISVTGSISGASVSATTGTFTTLSGNTTAGTTATFVTGVFTTSLSGATITGNTGQFSNITGVSGVFTTRISGATITGNTGQFGSITGISGVFTSVSGTTFTVTSGVFASGTAAAPSVSVGTTTNGLYSSATNEVALATNSSSRLVVDASGNVNIDSGTFYVDAVGNRTGVNNTSPGSYNAAADDLVVGLTGDTGVTIASTNQGSIFFADSTTGGAQQAAGYLYYLHSNDSMGFGTANTLWMTLDASGRLMVGPSTATQTLDVYAASYPLINCRTGGNTSAGFGSSTDNGTNIWFIGARKDNFGGSAGNDRFNLLYNTNTIMTALTSGNVGIGTTSPGTLLTVNSSYAGYGGAAITGDTCLLSVTGSAEKTIRIDGGLYQNGTCTANLHLSNSGANNYNATDTGFRLQANYNGTTGVGYFSIDSSAYSGSAYAYTPRLRIDNAGRLLVGTSSARTNFFNASVSALYQVEGANNTDQRMSAQIYGSADAASSVYIFAKHRSNSVGGITLVSNNDELGQISFQGSDGSQFVAGAQISAFVDGAPGADDMPGRLVFSTTADGASSPTPRMTIKNSGNIHFNDFTDTDVSNNITSAFIAATGRWIYSGKNADTVLDVNQTFDDTNARSAVRFYRNETQVGSISVSTTATAYNINSDYRLKQNITPVVDGISRLQQLKPCRFNFIAEPDTEVDGFIAHEVQLIVPEAITGEKDAVNADGVPIYQSIDQSKLIPLLTAALQEAIAKIESLESRLTAAGI